MKGSVDLVRRRLDMEAVVAPEISATVGVSTRVAVNPIVSAAVFAAVKCWGRYGARMLHFAISHYGPVDAPRISSCASNKASNMLTGRGIAPLSK